LEHGINRDVITAKFEKGYVQLTADQQPYLQGFMPIMNAFLTKNFEPGGLEIEIKNEGKSAIFISHNIYHESGEF
jgi:hypothetical protein